MGLPRGEHILVWMSDGARAERMRAEIENLGLAAVWAASLPEAIAAVDHCFPRAVVCRLDGQAPSLMDLETLLANLTLGRSAVRLPPIPIWALTATPADCAPRIEQLGLPVRLVPLESGSEGLLAELVHYLKGQGRPAGLLPGISHSVIFVSADLRAGLNLARYLGARGIPTIPCERPDLALERLATGEIEALVAELPEQAEALEFLDEVARRAPGLPVVGLVALESWLSHLAPPQLPAALACTLAKPVKAERLEACLRRLLRSPDVLPAKPGDQERRPGVGAAG